jgi:YegS/Rv2252/BmrU family lipid kinase
MFHIIDNPTAGKKGHQKNLETVLRVFDERGVEHVVHTTTHKGEVRKIVERLTQDGGKDIIVVGGDGTIHEVLNGMKNPAECRLGIIPSGTGNDFADASNLPLDAEKAALLILDGEAKDTDYIEVGEKRCMNICGLGMDVDVLERCNRGKMRGKPKYLMSLIVSFFTYKGCWVTVDSNGEQVKKNVLLADVCNGKVYGGGIKISPASVIDDGKFDVILVDYFKGYCKLIGAFMKLMKGKILEYPATTHYLAEEIKFTFDKEITYQLDGELYKGTEFDAKLCKGLKVFR